MKEKLNEQIQTSAIKLAELQTEQSELQSKLTIAANDADDVSIIKLRHRITDLPVEIFAAQLRLKRLQLQRDEETLPELEAEAQRLSPPIFELQKQIAELQTKLNKAVGCQQDASQNVKDLKERIRDGKFEINRLVKSVKPTTSASGQSLSMNLGG